jgi:hypothetical protein
MDPRLLAAFDALRAESAVAPDPGATARARAAMHAARAARPQLGGLALLGAHLRHALRPQRLLAVGGGLVAGLTVVSVLGWNAPAGSALHGVRVAHESVVLVFPGTDRIGLDLDYAESRLHEAQSAASSSSLDEAEGLLDDARQHLAVGSSQWTRWQDDEKLLGDLRHQDEGGDNGGTVPGGSGGAAGSSGTTTTHSESESSSSPTRSESHSSSSDGAEGAPSSSSTTSKSSSSSSASSD